MSPWIFHQTVDKFTTRTKTHSQCTCAPNNSPRSRKSTINNKHASAAKNNNTSRKKKPRQDDTNDLADRLDVCAAKKKKKISHSLLRCLKRSGPRLKYAAYSGGLTLSADSFISSNGRKEAAARTSELPFQLERQVLSSIHVFLMGTGRTGNTPEQQPTEG